MSAVVIDGTGFAEELRAEVEERVRGLASIGVRPGLATVLVGEDYAAQAYERRVRRVAEEIGCRYTSELLASDVEGNRSLIDDGSTGFLFRNEAELERRAAELVRDPALRRRLGQTGRDLVARRYPPEREVEGYRAVYGGLVPILA